MCGTQEEAGKAILHEVGIQPYDDLMQAAKKAVELARNGS
jgi:succinyl-CoA synthetase beta subunit